KNGDVSDPNMEAGTAVICVLRLLANYKGAFLYVPRPGMGEAVIAPLYQVLRNRGGKFEFFHKVSRLELSASKTRVGRIHFDQQARLKDGTYRPLITVKGLDCFPAEPLWEQIEKGDEMKSSALNLETKWDQQRPPPGTRVLKFGKDNEFEHVVLAL